MAKLGKFLNTTSAKINALEFGGKPRPYLGMSGIGFHCSKGIFLQFHWAQVNRHTARTERIFNAGHLFEPQLITQLKLAGLEVYKILKDTEENRAQSEIYEFLDDGTIKVAHYGQPDELQEEYVGFAKHAKGHSDGRVKGVIEAPDEEHILEAKTMKESKFKNLCKEGVKKECPEYYAQCQRYMRGSGLKWALFIAINKNTSHLYIERVKYLDKFAQDLVRKEHTIIMSDIVPSNNYAKNYYKCDMCFQREVCKGEIPVAKNCRTCKFCDIEDEGRWSCAWKDRKYLSTEEQRIGCEHYQLGWGLEDL